LDLFQNYGNNPKIKKEISTKKIRFQEKRLPLDLGF
jgi:hypothetical protein